MEEGDGGHAKWEAACEGALAAQSVWPFQRVGGAQLDCNGLPNMGGTCQTLHFKHACLPTWTATALAT